MTDQVQWSNDATQLRLTSIENDMADLKKRFDAIGRGLESCLKALKGTAQHLAVVDSTVGFLLDKQMSPEQFAKEFHAWFEVKKKEDAERNRKLAEANIKLPTSAKERQ